MSFVDILGDSPALTTSEAMPDRGPNLNRTKN
jgi:hypothetical protein